MDKNLEVRIKLEALISEREGMISFNSIHVPLGDLQPFDYGEFYKNAEAMRALLESEAGKPAPVRVSREWVDK